MRLEVDGLEDEAAAPAQAYSPRLVTRSWSRFESERTSEGVGAARVAWRFDPGRIPVAGLVASLELRGRILDLAVTEPSIEEVVKRLFRGDR